MPLRKYEVEYSLDAQAAMALLQQIQQAWAGVQQAQANANQSAGQMASTTAGIVPAITAMNVGMQALQKAMSEIVAIGYEMKQNFRDSLEISDKLAENAGKLRNQLRESQFTSRDSPDNLTAVWDMAIKSGSTAGDAGKIRQSFFGAADPAVQAGTLPKAEADKMASGVAELAAATGVDPAALGEMAGRMVLSDNIKDSDTGLKKVRQAIGMLGWGGVGELKPLAQSFGKIVAETTGKGAFKFGSSDEVAAALAAESRNATPREAGQRIRQAYSGLANLKDEGLDQLGLNRGMGFMDAIAAIATVPEDQRRDVLKAAGISDEDSRSLLDFAKLQSSGAIKQVREDVEKGKSGVDVDAKVKEYRESDTHKRNVADASLAKAEYDRGAMASPARTADIAAKANLTAKGEIGTVEAKNADTLRGVARNIGRLIMAGTGLGGGAGAAFADWSMDPGEETRRTRSEAAAKIMEAHPEARGTREEQILSSAGASEEARGLALKNIREGTTTKAVETTSPDVVNAITGLVNVLLGSSPSGAVTEPARDTATTVPFR